MLHVEEFKLGQDTLRLETGKMALQADASVVLRSGQAFLLATLVLGPKLDTAPNPTPLRVDYRERQSAIGQIPLGNKRRELRHSDREILISRLVDRLLRPAIPAAFPHEVQLNILVLGAEEHSDLPSLALIAAGAALRLSPIPSPTVAGLRFAQRGQDLVAFPQPKAQRRADALWTLGASRGGLLMVEGESQDSDEEKATQALQRAHGLILPVLDALDALAAKAERGTHTEISAPSLSAFERRDGRRPDEIRPIQAEVALLPSNHGSALFSRGQTQALTSVTLGRPEEGLIDEGLIENTHQRFYLHYNFHPFAVQVAQPHRQPKRREIGHGALAQKALEAVMPPAADLPYAVRVVSDILGSDGSSSMATVAAASLALMDAGIPISQPVAGIAMGKIRLDGGPVYLSDITATEDQEGLMDLKIAGTPESLVAFQLDVKDEALSLDELPAIFSQARDGLNHILAEMGQCLSESRAEFAANAPQVHTLQIAPHKVGILIGQGGKTIKNIQSKTKSRIEVNDKGRVRILTKSREDLENALQRIDALVGDLNTNEVYDAEVTSIQNYGAFVRIGHHEGLVHISELDTEKVAKVEEITQVGERIRVKVLGTSRGKLVLSRKAALTSD